MPQRILVLGSGFAGLWAALGAVRKLDEMAVAPEEVGVTLVNRDAYHGIRVRNYEADLTGVRIPLDDVLKPAGVDRVEAEVVSLDIERHEVQVAPGNGAAIQTFGYDRLVFALGSQLQWPNVPGLKEHAFDVDTYGGAERLNAHLRTLTRQPASPGRATVLIVGAGLTGIEAAAEMPDKLRALSEEAGEGRAFRVILADHNSYVGSDMGEEARPIIEEALRALGVETRTGVSVAAVDVAGATLASGEAIPAATVVWCAGMHANPLTRFLPGEKDRLGRVSVDKFLRVQGVPDVFAAGDSAWNWMDETHASVMSCQHGRPMGRFAGHNVVADLLGLPLLPVRIDWYVTVLDLGAWGALYTEGWGRRVASVGAAAKKTKLVINRERIYPPLTRNRRAILDAAAPTVQQQPANYH